MTQVAASGGATVTAMALTPGDKAPAITLLDQHGEKVKLADFKGRKVLVFFYPKADTPGCTTQACGMRDILGDIGDTAVLGISPDKPAKQAKFDEKYGLGFPLLADEDHAVAEAYGAWGEKSMYGKKYHGHHPLGVPRRRGRQDRAGLAEGEPQGHARQPAQVAGRLSWLAALPAPAEVLPHRPPFLFVDELVAVDPGQVARRAAGTSPATRRSSPVTSPAVRRCPAC